LLLGAILSWLIGPQLNPLSRLGLTLSAVGFSAVIAGIVVRLWALSSICENKTQHLVTTGLYSICRNPLYLGTLLIVLGFLGLWHSSILALFAIPPILLYPLAVVPLEERILRQRHGAEFDAYCRRTPRWFPRSYGYVAEIRPSTRSPGFLREVQAGGWWVGFALLSFGLALVRSGISLRHLIPGI